MVIDFLTTPLVDRWTESERWRWTIERLPTADPVKFEDSVRRPTPVRVGGWDHDFVAVVERPAPRLDSAMESVFRQDLWDYQEFRARGRFSSLADEPFAEDDGELGLGLEPFARRPFPFVSRVVQNQV